MRVLIVEDERKVARALADGLGAEGHSVKAAATGEEAFFLAQAEPFDLILLDLMLPGRDGIEILRTLRKNRIATPVLILTARDAVEDRVLGLDSGADDYLVKPFAFPELLARIRALERRGRNEGGSLLAAGDLEMDRSSRRVSRAGTAIDLTPKEFELLEYLLLNQGQTVSREMLAKEVWGEAARATPLDNVIDVHIARLRKKVDASFKDRLIHTQRGVGFILRQGTDGQTP